MKNLLLVTLFLLGIGSAQAQTEEQAYLIGQLIEQASQEEILSQQMAKTYVAIYIGIQPLENRKLLTQQIKSFEQQLEALKIAKLNNRINKQIKQVEKNWVSYKEIITQRPSSASLKLLLTEQQRLLEETATLRQQVVKHAKRFSAKSEITLLNNEVVELEQIAGQQQMLAERVLFFYLAEQAMIADNKEIQKGLEQSIKSYEHALGQLLSATANTAEIDLRLSILAKEWQRISQDMQEKKDNHILLQETELLSTHIHEVTLLYEQLIDQSIAGLMLQSAIEMANEQSILSQKIVKNYIAEGLDLNAKQARKELTEQLESFESNMDELKLFAPVPEITTALDRVDAAWTDFRNLAIETASSENAKKLLLQAEDLFSSSENVVLLLEMYAKVYKGKVNRYNSQLADWNHRLSQQEMLSERILMYSYALSWNILPEVSTNKLEKLGYEYLSNLDELEANGHKIEDWKKHREKLLKDWEQIKSQLSSDETSNDMIISWAEELSKEITQLTQNYKNSMNQLLAEEAINKAEMQALLSQKIAVAYLAVNMGLDEDNFKLDLKKDKLRFQRNLTELQAFAQNSASQEKVQRLQQLWNNYQLNFNYHLSDEEIGRLLQSSFQILSTAEALATTLAKETKTEVGALVNQAARLRTLSEQILLYSLAKRKGIDLDALNIDLERIFKDFQTTAQLLQKAKLNSSESQKHLQNIFQALEHLDSAVHSKEIDLYSIISRHHVLLLETERLTKTYEDLAF